MDRLVKIVRLADAAELIWQTGKECRCAKLTRTDSYYVVVSEDSFESSQFLDQVPLWPVGVGAASLERIVRNRR